MGEEADYLYEQYIDSLGMEDDGMGEPDAPVFKTCRYCGKTGLEWGSIVLEKGSKPIWRLFDAKGIHQCLVKSLPEKPKPREITDPVEKAFRAGYGIGYDRAEARAYPDVGFGSGGLSVDQAWREYSTVKKAINQTPSPVGYATPLYAFVTSERRWAIKPPVDGKDNRRNR